MKFRKRVRFNLSAEVENIPFEVRGYLLSNARDLLCTSCNSAGMFASKFALSEFDDYEGRTIAFQSVIEFIMMPNHARGHGRTTGLKMSLKSRLLQQRIVEQREEVQVIVIDERPKIQVIDISKSREYIRFFRVSESIADRG